MFHQSLIALFREIRCRRPRYTCDEKQSPDREQHSLQQALGLVLGPRAEPMSPGLRPQPPPIFRTAPARGPRRDSTARPPPDRESARAFSGYFARIFFKSLTGSRGILQRYFMIALRQSAFQL